MHAPPARPPGSARAARPPGLLAPRTPAPTVSPCPWPQVLTGESWSEAIARPLVYGTDSVNAPSSNAVIAAVFFVIFLLLNSIVLINVVVAVLLEKMVDDTNTARLARLTCHLARPRPDAPALPRSPSGARSRRAPHPPPPPSPRVLQPPSCQGEEEEEEEEKDGEDEGRIASTDPAGGSDSPASVMMGEPAGSPRELSRRKASKDDVKGEIASLHKALDRIQTRLDGMEERRAAGRSVPSEAARAVAVPLATRNRYDSRAPRACLLLDPRLHRDGEAVAAAPGTA